MLATPFAFHAPTSLDAALELLAGHEGAKVLSGGMSMVPAMNLGILRPEAVISLNHVPGLDEVAESAGRLRLGALVRHRQVAADPLVRERAPLLAEAAGHIGDVQVRNRGTIGGSVAHADPAADYLPTLVALDATVEVASASGRRTIPARTLFVDLMQTALEPAEIIVAIDVPVAEPGVTSAYERFARVEGSFPIANAAAVVDGPRIAVGIGGVTAVPVLIELTAGDVEPEAETLERVGDEAFAACADAFGDLNGSPGYRRAMARVCAQRVVRRALATRGDSVGRKEP